MLLQMISGLTEWQKTTLMTSMNGSYGPIHLLGEELPNLTPNLTPNSPDDNFRAAG
jgi:hypothetical protein